MNHSIGNTPKNYAVLPFYITAAIFFLFLTVMLYFASDQFVTHYFQGKTLALVHTAALGWITMIIFGAAYQLLPVLFEQNLFSSKLAFSSYCTLLIGSGMLIYSFWYFIPGWVMIVGGSFVLIASLMYLINVLLTARLPKNLKVETLFILSSALYYFVTTIIGLLLAINLKYPYFTISHMEILKIHAHIGFVGWFLQLITGVSIRLVPMFLLSKSKKSKLLKYAFALQNIGLLLFVADRYFTQNSIRTYLYLFIISAGIGCWFLYLYDTFKNRLKRNIEVQMRFTILSFLFLIATLLIALSIMILSDLQWSILYGTYIFMGWLTALVLGKTFKTLPFIVWNFRYKNHHGKMKIPMPKDLYIEKWITYQF